MHLDIFTYWNVTATVDTPKVNDLVSKIGITTGWTQAYVAKSCVNTKGPVRGVYYLCQDYTNFGADEGDSGAPVLLNINPLPDTTVTLGGLLYGASPQYVIFTPWSGIAVEYPGITAH